MKHYGDIKEVDGRKVPIVDIICGGSPCQDLSIAGGRAGLSGERSGLFMEQIRIVKEQRDECLRQLQLRGADIDVRSIRPRYLIWENVPGAFSSNKGEDFRCVLEEICRIADKTATVPMPEKGKWSNSGLIVGDGWSVGWRVHDAQFWGVPQRRRRISVVADFGSESVAEILFERDCVSGNIEQSVQKREEFAGDIGEGTYQTISFQERAGCPGGGKGILIQNEKTASIRTQQNQSVCVTEPIVLESNQNKAEISQTGICNTIPASAGMGGGYVPMITIEGNGSRDSHKGDGYKESETMYTLNTVEQHAVCIGNGQVNDAMTPSIEVSKSLNCMVDPMKVVCIGNGQTAQTKMSDKVGALNCMHDQQAVMVYGLDRASFNQGQNAKFDFSVEEELSPTLVNRGPGGVLTKQ